jgi:hypothetical protein|tara:strand:- start:211 stop:333 length:123 start_codon:yes stop_codon:yes gene_type:complete
MIKNSAFEGKEEEIKSDARTDRQTTNRRKRTKKTRIQNNK